MSGDHEPTGEAHRPVAREGRTVCSCGDFNCASLDVVVSDDELDLDAIEARADAMRYGKQSRIAMRLAREDVPALVAEVRRLRALVPSPDLGDLDCRTCGHRRRDHIYEEGACRPGYPCAGSCTLYVPDVKP